MRIEISKVTLEYILQQYPHLDEPTIELLFRHGRIRTEPVPDVYGYESETYIIPQSHTLVLPHSLAEYFGVEEGIELIPDAEGIIYKTYENEKERDK